MMRWSLVGGHYQRDGDKNLPTNKVQGSRCGEGVFVILIRGDRDSES